MDANRLARTEHPDTSHDAAEEVAGTLGSRCMQALQVLTRHPGSTARELDYFVGSNDGAVRKRLNDLRIRRLAKTIGKRKCRVTGRAALVWDVVRACDDTQQVLDFG